MPAFGAINRRDLISCLKQPGFEGHTQVISYPVQQCP